MCVGVMLACMSIYHMHTVAMASKRVLHPMGTGLTDSCELLCGCWASNPGPQDEHRALNHAL